MKYLYKFFKICYRLHLTVIKLILFLKMNFECADMIHIYCASLQSSLFCITRLRKLYMADIIPLQPVPGLIPTGTNSSNLSVKKKKKKRGLGVTRLFTSPPIIGSLWEKPCP